MNGYVTVYHLLVNYGFGDGWEDEVAESTRAEILERAREYRENCPEYPVKIVRRKERMS